MFDDEAAFGFLTAYGVEDEALARNAVRQLGGNPLTLKLAAELIKKDARALVDVRTKRLFILRVRDEAIQGQLYRRILGRIHDDSVRKLAHPGLVLRRITAPIIKEVLAQPCEVVVPDLPAADVLFRGHPLRIEVEDI